MARTVSAATERPSTGDGLAVRTVSSPVKAIIAGVFAALALIPTVDAARIRASRPPLERILWIGAHPDDEALIAPLIGPRCTSGARCSLLVMTRGERGVCLLPAGCGGDLGSVRSSEMDRAAAILGAHLTLWSFSDVSTDVVASWSAEAGGHDALIERIRGVIAAEKPTVIYTFDPNHGSTCHPAHRAVAELVLEAATVRVILLETAVDAGPDTFAFHAAAPDAVEFNAEASWDFLVRDVEAHPSQFSPAQIESLRNEPVEQRRVWLATLPVQTHSCDK
jgi:LmbE family N-acetylglucosaminyl deacetylase